MSARPRTWWHWLNGNITIDGIDKDLVWLASVGIGGVQNFDASLTTPQIVDKRLVYMDPDWKAAFRHAVERADAHGLEFAIASSPGWSETGGPWVRPEDGMKKLTWSETVLPGGQPFKGKLAPPPSKTGPYQTVSVEEVFGDPGAKKAAAPQASGDIAVLAVPMAQAPLPAATFAKRADGSSADLAALTGADLESAVEIPAGTAENPATLTIGYVRPVTVGSARLFIQDAQPPFAPPRYRVRLQALEGDTWRDVSDIPLGAAAATVSFKPVTAARFRIAVTPGPGRPAGGLGSVPGAVVMNLFPPKSTTHIAIGQFELFAQERVNQAEAKAGFGTVPNYYAIATKQVVKGPAPAQVIDLTGKLKPDGTLDWTPPKGSSWRVLRFGWSLTGKTNHPATAEATGLEVDKYDAAAVERYINGYLAMYRDTVGADNIGTKGIRALLTDSIEVGASNWTPRMIAEFKARRGYDPLPWMPALAGTIIGSAAQSDKFLYDYRRTLADLIADAHYGTIAKVAHAHGLKVYGEALEDGRPVLGDDLDMRHYADVPMSALWTFPKGGKPRPGLMGDMKGASSVAHFYGQNLVAAESMTAAFSPWAFAPHDLKHVIDLEFLQGVNRPVIHTSPHSPSDTKLPGLSLGPFGQYFNRHETWADMARPWIDYIARSGYMLQQGRDAADIAVFYGEESPVTVLYGQGAPKWQPQGHAFDLVNAKMLASLTAGGDGEMLSPGGAHYKALFLAGTSDHMTMSALRQIKRLADAGVRVIGQRPVADPSMDDPEGRFAALVDEIWSMPNVVAESDAGKGMTHFGIADDFKAVGGDTGADLRFVHRKLADGDVYFVNNREEHAVKADIRFRVAGKVPELWEAIGGTMRPLSYSSDGKATTVPLDLGPESAVFVVFRKDTAAASATVAPAVTRTVAAVSGPWTVTFQKDRGAPATISMAKLAPLNTNADPGVRYFSGTATYTATIEQPKGIAKGEKLWLDLGKVGDVAQVLVNGQPAGIAWFAPYRVEVGSLLKRGSNRLDIKVADLWVNRLIGDQQPGAHPITWTALPAYRPDAPLRPSGLIGPVTLETERQD
ncbi:glycosyl hydrolase [Novosphingobium beihaiensis]|uniref:Glycoside hydrolase n=1 Tax=Novosphingobium beihaiensis TaxID=2930389 RepID=A0ABT0BM07_9SPHN|nr:glycosyl hydrolase [Novosphingobium beihaiensis]MCJ2185866.1 glycoside hydrolase [Novosphingobium beihaiensis]